MPSIEQAAKAQFAKVFTTADWPDFKRIADRYFERSARLRKADMLEFPPNTRLLARNIEKRLFIGIGTARWCSRTRSSGRRPIRSTSMAFVRS